MHFGYDATVSCGRAIDNGHMYYDKIRSYNAVLTKIEQLVARGEAELIYVDNRRWERRVVAFRFKSDAAYERASHRLRELGSKLAYGTWDPHGDWDYGSDARYLKDETYEEDLKRHADTMAYYDARARERVLEHVRARPRGRKARRARSREIRRKWREGFDPMPAHDDVTESTRYASHSGEAWPYDD